MRILNRTRIPVSAQQKMGSEFRGAVSDPSAVISLVTSNTDRIEDLEATPVTHRQISANYSVADDDLVIIADASSGNISVTLPTLSQRIITVKKIDATGNTVTVSHASVNIDGSASHVLSSQYESMTVAGGSEWHLV